jgi:hypothetical protein
MSKLTSCRLGEVCKLIGRGLGADKEMMGESKESHFKKNMVYINSILYASQEKIRSYFNYFRCLLEACWDQV